MLDISTINEFRLFQHIPYYKFVFVSILRLGNEARAYWSSFLDGMQRVLLFTPEVTIAHSAHMAGEAGAIKTEVTLSMHGIGLSLVNNDIRQEIMYISIARSVQITCIRIYNTYTVLQDRPLPGLSVP